ncbi:MAG: hypothetical protein KJO36_06040 [Acidimicrobiia bacterium]|nr:hypothetical protein [Acidimicrobiia bacterium]
MIPGIDRITEAALGHHGEKQRELARRGLSWLETVLRKNTDYNASAYSPPLLLPRMRADTAILVRMSDKAYRIASLIEKGTNQVRGETLEDAVSDLGGYCLLWLCVSGERVCPIYEREESERGVGMALTKEVDDEDPEATDGVAEGVALPDPVLGGDATVTVCSDNCVDG